MSGAPLPRELGSEDLRDLATSLQVFASHPEIRRAWLFGSAGCGRPMDWRSDLDFAVEGLPPGGEYALWSELDGVLARQVDLVRFEDAKELLRDEIKKGRIIYEN